MIIEQVENNNEVLLSKESTIEYLHILKVMIFYYDMTHLGEDTSDLNLRRDMVVADPAQVKVFVVKLDDDFNYRVKMQYDGQEAIFEHDDGLERARNKGESLELKDKSLTKLFLESQKERMKEKN